MTTQRSLAPALALDQLEEAREALEKAHAAVASAADHLDEPEKGAVIGLRAELGSDLRRVDSLRNFIRTAHGVGK